MLPLISSNKSGFRLSILDLFFISILCLALYFFPDSIMHAGFIKALIVYVSLSFFMFCNIFRVRTKYELCWTAIFFINAAALTVTGHDVMIFFVVQSIATLIAVTMEIKSNTYHGIFCKVKK